MAAIKIDEKLLDSKFTELEAVRSWSPRVISKLETMIHTAEDYDLFRINPVEYALSKGLSNSEAIDLFLYGTKVGLFEMEWHLTCAFCANIVDSFRDLIDDNQEQKIQKVHLKLANSKFIDKNRELIPQKLVIEPCTLQL